MKLEYLFSGDNSWWIKIILNNPFDCEYGMQFQGVRIYRADGVMCHNPKCYYWVDQIYKNNP